MGLTQILQENDRYLKERRAYLGVNDTFYRRLYEECDPYPGQRPTEPYTETFSEYCDAMCSTDLLKDEEKVIIRKLLAQWRMNKK